MLYKKIKNNNAFLLPSQKENKLQNVGVKILITHLIIKRSFIS